MKRTFSRAQFIAIGFFLIITIGSLLLILPFSSRSNEFTNPIDAVFTATSATCVTGLITVDTYTHWSFFGQLVIITMIQIGGLGFITFGVYGMMLLRKKIGLKDRELVHDSLNSMHVGGGVRLVKQIVSGTFIIEGIAAVILAIRFVPDMGWANGIFFAVFHSVSAFCNAGFDLMGGSSGEYSSLTAYAGDITVNVVLMLLIIIGGIGFLVWGDIARNKWHFKRYMLHTKVVLTVTTILLVGGTVFFMISESGGVMSAMSLKEKILSSMFSSVTPRTAGFNTVDTASLSGAGKTMTVLLMFIGGSPGSTAGGIKTTTLAVIFFFIFSYIKHQKGCNAYKRRIDDDLIKKASTVFFINLTLVITSILIILINQNLPVVDVAFETVSAISTVGMSTGITRELSILSKIVIMLLMYCGRVGSLSFALSFSEKRKAPDIRYPSEDILVG